MKPCDLDALVREHAPSFGLFDRKGVERLREDAARHGGAADRARRHAEDMRRNSIAISAIVESLRAEGRYDISDRLRAIAADLEKASRL